MAFFTNQAQLSYNGNVTNSNITTGELVSVLSATKTAVKKEYGRNSDVTFVISIVNAGSTPFTNLTVNDNLGEYSYTNTTVYPLSYEENSLLYYTNGVLQATPSVTAGPPLVISGINVPANGNATIIFDAKVNQYAPLSQVSNIINQATVYGEGIANNLVVSEQINTEKVSDLSISKSLSPTTVTENGQINYTFTIENYGNTAATTTDDIVLTDTFNPALSNISVKFNNVVWTSPENYTYNESTGEFATVSGQITVPAATYTQSVENGSWEVTPGVSTVTVSGTI